MYIAPGRLTLFPHLVKSWKVTVLYFIYNILFYKSTEIWFKFSSVELSWENPIVVIDETKNPFGKKKFCFVVWDTFWRSGFSFFSPYIPWDDKKQQMFIVIWKGTLTKILKSGCVFFYIRFIHIEISLP